MPYVIGYLTMSYIVVSALMLRLINRTSPSGSSRAKWRAAGFRLAVGLLVLVGLSFLLAVTVEQPRGWTWVLWVPGFLVGMAFLASAYASPMLVFSICVLIVVLSFRTFRQTRTRTDRPAWRARTASVCAMLLLPLVPYAVVEGQTLMFRHTLTKVVYQHPACDHPDGWKVLSIGLNRAVVGIPSFRRDVLYLRRIDGKWHEDRCIGIRGEYPGVFPPYCDLTP